MPVCETWFFTVTYAYDRGADESIWTSQKKKLRGQKNLHNEQSSLFDFFIRYYSFHQTKGDRVGAASSTHRRQTNVYILNSKIVKEKNTCETKA